MDPKTNLVLPVSSTSRTAQQRVLILNVMFVWILKGYIYDSLYKINQYIVQVSRGDGPG